MKDLSTNGPLTPEQQAMADSPAYDNALEANKYFDQLEEGAVNLASVAARSLVNPDLNKKPGSGYAIAIEMFQEAEQNFAAFQKAAEVLMPPRLAFETQEDVEPFASETVWNAMSPEQRTKANKLREAVAEDYESYGVTTESLRVVMTETEEGAKVFTLVQTNNGIDIGDHKKDYDKARRYNGVMSKKNDTLFKVSVDGQTYDMRSGMTDPVYYALYQDSLDRDVTLPDSPAMAKENDNDLWTYTMLTGEPLTADGHVLIRRVFVDGVGGLVVHPDYDLRYLRVRLAAVIE